MEPNKTNLRKWVAALRSGKYIQGSKRLRQEVDGVTTHCCLGVACELAIADGVDIRVVTTNIEVTYFDYEPGQLPRKVQDWLGVYSGNPPISDDSYAIEANDTLGWDFAQIASAVERYYGLLETK